VVGPIIQQFSPREYFEPFLGGGAVFFALGSTPAVLSDANDELINTYEQVRDAPEAILKQLKELPVTRAAYDQVRRAALTDPLERAVRFLYLNRTSFSGIYRVNRKGEFNVPYGGGERTTATLTETGLLEKAAKALDGATIVVSDFEAIIDRASRGGVVYCDPCYVGSSRIDSFRRYNRDPFEWSDQERLAKACLAAQSRGASVLISNRPDPDLLELYRGAEVIRLVRQSRIAAAPSARGTRDEVLLVLRARRLRTSGGRRPKR
jgi:DNA adenine methylase